MEENVNVKKKDINNNPVMSRFEFRLTANDNIVCQRYVIIDNFKPESYGTQNFTNALRRSVRYIKQDLKEKSDIYNWMTAPQVFDTVDQMYELLGGHVLNVTPFSYVITRDSDQTYFWDGEEITTCDVSINRNDYLGVVDPEMKCQLKLAFLDNGREVISEVWDGMIYPRFVRRNIDLSNQKNVYEVDGQFSFYDTELLRAMIKNRRDLIPVIAREFVRACTDDYYPHASELKYGDKVYNMDLEFQERKEVRKVENRYKKRTERYFSNLY